MANQPIIQVGYGLTQALENVFPAPIAAKRVPTTADTGYQIGQIWVYVAGNAPYILTSVASGSATWLLLESGGGAGVFASLTVTPGPTSLTGTTGINTAGAGVTTINTGGTGALNLGNATGNTAVTGSLTASTGLVATTGGITATGTSSITGTTTINTSGAANTNIGTSTNTGIVVIGNTTGNVSLIGNNLNTGTFGATQVITAGVSVPVAAGGAAYFNAGAGVTSPQIIAGSGAPTFAAKKGSLYLRTDGTGTTDRAFIATDAVGTWTALTTVA